MKHNKRKNSSDRSSKKRKKQRHYQNKTGKDGRIISVKGILCTAFMAICFGVPGITIAETWPAGNELMICARLAAYTGAVVLAVLAVLSAYNKRRLLIIAGLVFGGAYLFGRLHTGGTAAKIIYLISMADAVLCVIAGIIPAFIVYLILRLVSGRVADAVVYKIVRWILIVVVGFVFGNLLYRLFSGRRSDRGKRRRTKRRRKRRKDRKEKDPDNDNNGKTGKREEQQPGNQKNAGNNETSRLPEIKKEENEENSHSEWPSDSREDRTDTDDDDYYYDEELSVEEEEERPAILDKIIKREDGSRGFIQNHDGKYTILFEDGSTSEVRTQNNKYYYESRPGVWTLIK